MMKQMLFNNQPLVYSITGEGAPVVLLHGFAEDGRIWDPQLPALENNCRLIIPDLPGSGMSPMNTDQSMEGLAEAVKHILDEESISRCIMIGHSMGGYVTLAFAEAYPERLLAMGLFHSTAFADSEEKKQVRLKNIAFIEKHGTAAFLKQSTPGLFGEQYREQQKAVVDRIIDQYSGFEPASLVAYYRAMIARPDRTGVLKNFVKPVLFIIGKSDNAIPFAESTRLCHLPSLSYIHILENCGHMGMFEETDRCNNILQHFINDTVVGYFRE